MGRVWAMGGLWDEVAWRRRPHIEQLDLSVWENGEKLWLYRVEEEVVMVEVKPSPSVESGVIGQVVLKRLITADQAIDILCSANKQIANL